jgi:hypothetical protein
MADVDSVESMLHVLWEESTDMFGTVAVHLFLQSTPYAGDALPTFSHNPGPAIDQEEERFVRSPDLHRLLHWVIDADQPLFIDPQKAIQTPDVHYYQESGHSVLVPIPGSLEIAGGVLLLLAPSSARPFDETDLVVIRTIANSASATISNRNLAKVPALIPA